RGVTQRKIPLRNAAVKKSSAPGLRRACRKRLRGMLPKRSRINKVVLVGGLRDACTCLKIMPDTEIIEKTNQFPGYFLLVNKETG
ncbi:MAG: hypothetical protein ACK5Q2_14140, partial [Bacteroidota bacterium]